MDFVPNGSSHGIALGLEVVAKLCHWVKVNLESLSYTSSLTVIISKLHAVSACVVVHPASWIMASHDPGLRGGRVMMVGVRRGTDLKKSDR